MRIQCGKPERKPGEADENYQTRIDRIKSLEELLREKMNESADDAAIKGRKECGVKKAKYPEKSAIISSPEALIVRLNYFEVFNNIGTRPSRLAFKYGL
jgi:hypothetical protein